MRKIIYQLIASTIISIICGLLFALYRSFFRGGIIFYEGIIFGGIFFILTTIAIIIFSKNKNFKTLQDTVLVSLIPGLLIYILFVSLIPTIIDRSVSITVLGKLAQCSEKGATVEELNSHFLKLYVGDGKAVKVRLREQIASGNVIDENSTYKLTKKGFLTMKVLHKIGEIFNVNMSYLNASTENNNTDK